MLKSERKSVFIIVFIVAVCSAVMCYIDAVIVPPYFVKSSIKLALFLLAPLAYFLFSKADGRSLVTLFTPKKKDLFISLAIGAAVYTVIVGGYFALRSFFDFSAITEQLNSGVGVGTDNFLLIAIYISFVNSLLEEFFFRGFAFLTLKNKMPRGLAYVFSSGLFAFYHVGMTAGWFSPVLYVLAMAGLFVGGCIFNYLNEKCGNIYPSWIVHMFANFAINTIGFILFGMI